MYYLSIGAQRIQGWLAATPKLDHLRGASHALAAITSKPDINEWRRSVGLADATICEQAGDVDGVVVLEHEDASTLEQAASHLLPHLGSQLPRVTWEGWLAEGSSFLSAFDRVDAGQAVRRYRWLPQPNDVPVLAQCDTCRSEPRAPSGDAEGPGADCAARVKYKDDARGLLAGIPGRWPRDFQDLARRGGRGPGATSKAIGRTDSRNHLALVKADGNKVGALFRELSRHEEQLPTLTSGAVADLDQATKAAVYTATSAITDEATTVKGAIAHYAAGDDVLVSVPAPNAWTFVNRLIADFEILQTTWHNRLKDDDPPQDIAKIVSDLIDQVSLGVGVVFTHETHPLADTFAIADQAERAAKQFAQGGHSAVAWVDLSAEGMAGVRQDSTWRQVVTRTQLMKDLDRTPEPCSAPTTLSETVMGLPPSARAQLGMVIRDAPEGATAAAVQSWCARRTTPVDPIADAAKAGNFDDLSSLLSRSRWWPSAAGEESET